MKRVLIVSPYFPPSMLAGVHRARHLAKHLPAAGWHPVVLCVDERFHEEKIDVELADLLPANLDIVKTTALSARLTRLTGIGDLSLRAFHHLMNSLREILDSRPIDAIFITGSPYYPMLFSRWLKQRYGKPIILDFQDPWVSAYGATRRKWSKEGVSHRLAIALEPRALRHADYITSVSDVQNAEMAARYPWFDRSQMKAIPIGGDPEDFNASRIRRPEQSCVRLDPARINLSYVGTFLPRSEPLARQLLRSLAALRHREPELATRICLNFVGTSNQPSGRNSFCVAPIAAQEGVGDLVAEIPQRVPFLDALALLANSQGLLLIGSDEPHYTASKIYPALMSGRPYLSLFHKASSAYTILSAAGGGLAFSFSTAEELAALQSDLTDGLRALAVAPDQFGRADPSVCAQYSARAMAGQFAEVFDALRRCSTNERGVKSGKIAHAI